MSIRPFVLTFFASAALVVGAGSPVGAARPPAPQAAPTPPANPPPDDRPRLSCSQIARRISGEPGSSVVVFCPGGCTRQTVWGSTVYADDSSICAAAVHSGAISAAKGGAVELHFLPGQDSYQGSEQNGITSLNWGPWRRSIAFSAPGQEPQLRVDDASTPTEEDTAVAPMRARAMMESRSSSPSTPPQPTASPRPDARAPRGGNQVIVTTDRNALPTALEVPGQINCQMRGQELPGEPGTETTVYCPAGCGRATAWGTDLYADDSSICTAAIHAGVILAERGGLVRVTIEAGGRDFAASSRNGVTTSRWRSWPRAFRVHTP